MEEWNPHATISLPPDCRSSFYGIAFDGCYFYFTAPQECYVYKMGRNFTMTNRIKTDKPYCCICYDCKDNCFWVTEKKNNDTIYRLDNNLKETGALRINHNHEACLSDTGLSYDCEKDTLLVAYKERIVEVSKGSGRACTIREACEESYTAVLSITPYYAVVQRDKKGQSMQIFTCDGHKSKNICLPDLYCIKDILFYPCSKSCKEELEIILLVTKDDCRQNVLLKINISGIILCCCNYKVCCAHCPEEGKNRQCINDVIESVALIETSLSHILNAEGEKLQKAVKLANSIDELLEINKSVTKTIINITQLEQNLYLKLDSLHDLPNRKIHNKEE